MESLTTDHLYEIKREQHFHEALFIMVYSAVLIQIMLNFQIKATEQCMYFAVVMFIMLYKVVLTSVFMNELIQCDHSKKLFPVVLCTVVCTACFSALIK